MILRFLIPLSLATAVALPLWAEGTCRWEHPRAVLEQAPELLEFLENTLVIEQTGIAHRLGRHYKDLSGMRVAPYTFRARSKANSEHVFELVVEANLTFFDSDGQIPPPEKAVLASQVRQILREIHLRPFSQQHLAGLDTEAEQARLATTRNELQALEAQKLSSRIVEIPALPGFRDGASGQAIYRTAPLSGKLIDVTITWETPNDQTERHRFVYFDEALSFVEITDGTWIESPQVAGEKLFQETHTKYYLHDSEVYWAEESRYSGKNRETLAQAQLSSRSKRLLIEGGISIPLFSRGSRLMGPRTPQALRQIFND